MFKKLGLYYRTIKHLRPIQIRYRLWYTLRDRIRALTGHTYPLSNPQKGHTLKLEKGCRSSVSGRPSSKTFTFLNLSHTFEGAIDWNFSQYGKLWAYNLNYFDYLRQEEVSREEGLALIREFIDHIEDNREGLEPYPISLRGINWIKFLSRHAIEDEQIDASLYAQYRILLDNLEYHLLGNHLLENGCSLLFGACYFRDGELYDKAREILIGELQEQVLEDGGHVERSTMYHGILLERLMDCYNLVLNNEWGRDEELEVLLGEKAELMLGWLEKMTIDRRPTTDESRPSSVSGQPSGSLPLLNDAAKGMGPEPGALFAYADRLGVEAEDVSLGESGYRTYLTDSLALICDVGAIGPDYQPGHAHSDTLSFVLYHEGRPVLIDPGISTYENGDRRQLERSTAFHNTVQLGDREQSEVWHAFRVGRRAHILELGETEENGNQTLTASHDGYEPWGVTHQRSWRLDNAPWCGISDY